MSYERSINWNTSGKTSREAQLEHQLAAVVQQRDELLAASEMAIEALQWNHDQGHKTDMTDEPRKRDARALRALRSAIAKVQP